LGGYLPSGSAQEEIRVRGGHEHHLFYQQGQIRARKLLALDFWLLAFGLFGKPEIKMVTALQRRSGNIRPQP